MKKIVKYYRRNDYGTMREYIHPDSKGDADIIHKLTGRRSIDGVVRELFRDISGGAIVWQEVLAP